MGNYYFVLEELKTMKESNEKAILELKKLEDNSFNNGYIAALKFQNRLLKSNISIYEKQSFKEVV